MQDLMCNLNFQVKIINILKDNESAIYLSKVVSMNKKSKHIEKHIGHLNLKILTFYLIFNVIFFF